MTRAEEIKSCAAAMRPCSACGSKRTELFAGSVGGLCVRKHYWECSACGRHPEPMSTYARAYDVWQDLNASAPKSRRRLKKSVRQNRWGNWRGYLGGKFDREFPHDGPSMPDGCAGLKVGSSTEMPDAAREWLADRITTD